MTAYLQHGGELVFVQGYAAPYNSLSIPLDSLDGRRELIRPRAFDHILRNLRASTTCTLHHMAAGGTIGSIFAGTLRLWSTPYGLAFECGPLAVNSKNAWAVKSIASGGVRACSWRGVPADVATEQIDGEQVVVIRKIQHLSHISPLSAAAASYPGAVTWCSHEHVDDLPDHLRPLARHRQEHHPSARAEARSATL